MTQPRISLEQWRSLLSVVDAGGYAQAAVAMHKSQSAVTYAVQKVEALLGVKVFSMVGRKAHLTPAGEVLYRRAKALLDEAGALEGAAGSLGAGWESELRIAAEIGDRQGRQLRRSEEVDCEVGVLLRAENSGNRGE